MDGADMTGHSCTDHDAYQSSRMMDMMHSELRALYSYWNGLRGGREVPLRADIDPRGMACDVRNLFILERAGARSVRFRLVGAAIIDALGVELRGATARALMAPLSRESFEALIFRTLEDPGVGYARLRGAAGDIGAWEMNLLPLASDFGMIDRAIGCLHPLSGVAPSTSRQPVHFCIEEMTVEPIDRTTGLAESPASFSPHPPGSDDTAPSQFLAIDGEGRDGKDRKKGGRRRGDHLRLVKK